MAVPGLPNEKIVSIAQKLPATACVLARLQSLLSDPNTSLDNVCGLLKRDPSLAARVLRISNSPYYASATPNASLEEAVGCIGFDEIHKVAGMSVGSQLLQRDLTAYGYSRDLLWHNSLCNAIAMESLAQFAGENPRSAYTGGLLRSMGKMALDRLAAETDPPGPAFAESGEPAVGEWEKRLWGCDGAAVTALLLEMWNFGPETIGTVKAHYAPGDDAPAGALLLNLACGITEAIGHGLAGEEPYWRSGADLLPRLGISQADLDLCAAETKMGFEAVQHSFAAAAVAA